MATCDFSIRKGTAAVTARLRNDDVLCVSEKMQRFFLFNSVSCEIVRQRPCEMTVGMMETTNRLLDINEVRVQCCERLVRIVYRPGITVLRICGSFRLYPTNLRTLVSYDDDGSSTISC